MLVRCGAWSFALPLARHRRDDRGVAAVEFAILLPVLMMVLFGIMGFGFTMAQSASLASGAREGARLGAVGGVVPTSGQHDCGDVVALARLQSQSIGIQPSDIEVKVYLVTEGTRVEPAICEALSGAANPTSAIAPCTNAEATAATQATVQVTTKVVGREFVIPVPGGSIVTPDVIEKTAEYRCEYH